MYAKYVFQLEHNAVVRGVRACIIEADLTFFGSEYDFDYRFSTVSVSFRAQKSTLTTSRTVSNLKFNTGFNISGFLNIDF